MSRRYGDLFLKIPAATPSGSDGPAALIRERNLRSLNHGKFNGTQHALRN